MPTAQTPRPLASALDAIEVILELLDAAPSTTSAALVEVPGGGSGVVSVDDGDPGPSGAALLAERLHTGLADVPGVRIVLVSVRNGAGDAVAEADLAMWRHLVRLHGGGTTTLLDWFVVTDEAILSLAELGGPPAPWSGP